jgi:hypothetical protein
MGSMRPFDVLHRDPHQLARSAAVRSRREQDDRTRAHSRELTIEERLREGLRLSRLAARLRAAGR